MPQPQPSSTLRVMERPPVPSNDPSRPMPVRSVNAGPPLESQSDHDPLLTVDDVARRLNVSRDWVWDHSSRKLPHLPVIRMGDGTLRYRFSGIEGFISEQEQLSAARRRRK
ncbi:helix-turn-helix transcriptional regulator [Acidicapsa ligni]|uniref:helix-turn-helix transcriptional regulator n=1 Tax=Acidicapsa ligni TaxID=542300 RepID=UPI0021DF50A0|nr:helix-turn-helix domain-containing protein [Acidicapsa ligni]